MHDDTPKPPETCTTDGDAFDPTIGPSGQQKNYKVLCEEEREKGFVRPVRDTYTHVGIRPTYPTRPLNAEEQGWWKDDPDGYVAFEEYPAGSPEWYPGTEHPGRYWTRAQLSSGCGTTTTMGRALAETYARDPKFYGATFCCRCGVHLPVEEFVWTGTTERVGS